MKKVIAINSSRRKQNTYLRLKEIGKILNRYNIEFEIINLHDYRIDYCNGCEICIIKDFCPINDDMNIINKKLIDADGLIFSSPVYMENLSGILKTFIDRNCKWFHRSPLIKKPFLAVSTTMSSGLKNTIDYLERVATRWGMVPCGSITRKLRTFDTSINEKEFGNFIKFVNNPKEIKQWISTSKIINFNVQKALALSLFEIDKKFWEEQDISKADYYYKISSDPFSRLFGKFIFSTINKNILKNKADH